MKNTRKSIFLLLLLLMIAGLMVGCGAVEDRDFREMADFEKARIGVMTGSSFDLLANAYFPDAKLYHMNMSDSILNLKQKKTDGILMDMAYFTPLIWEGETLSYVDMEMPATEYAVAFPKTAEAEVLKAQINEFIRTQTENGWLAQLEEKWFSASEPDGINDLTQLTGENGTLKVAATMDCKPFDYLKDGQYCGLDADFIFHFAKEYGYALEIDLLAFDALLPSLAAERYDLALSGITVTEERSETVLFSDAYYKSPIVMAMLSDKTATESKKTLSDFETATFGIVTGTSWDIVAQKQFPNAQRKYFASSADMLLALEQGKVDAFFADKTVYAGIRWENSSITTIDEPIEQLNNALIFAKEGYDETLFAQVNAFIAKSKDNGTLDRLCEKWFADEEPDEHPDYTRLTGENGTLHIAVCDAHKPVSYQKGTMYTGYEVDFLTLFAEEYGYQLDLRGMAFDALIPSVASGKSDIGACGITITAERMESVTFSDPHIETHGVVVVRNEADENSSKKTLDDFENATIGILTGSVYDQYAKTCFPNAKREYYTLLPDMVTAVTQGKVDGYLAENTYVTAAIWEGAQVESIGEPIDQTHAGYIFQKGEASAVLREQLNTFIRTSKEDGTLDALWAKWIGKTEPTEDLDYDALTGENGTIKVAVAPDLKPISYVKNGEMTGYEIELLLMFAKEYGYDLDMAYMSFDAILPGVTAGKYDIGTGAVTITEERAQSQDFSESHMTVDIVMVVKEDSDAAAEPSFWNEIKEDFEKTFIREDRWKLIMKGIGVTMLISICAAVGGSLLGFGLYMLSRSDAKALQLIAKIVAKIYSRIVAGTPIVVILMILFYVIFGRIQNMSGILVSIIGFTLTFGAFVYDHMTVSVGSVDRGQTEAAYALGYTKNKTFFRIIFPQAMTIFLPSYSGQAVELIKATAVVGYVAVNDLTKMGDIIRSNTYEAFFPLIATAVIYFLLTWILALLLKLLKLRFEPKRRRREDILKGVKTV